jgi:hypothetical protein
MGRRRPDLGDTADVAGHAHQACGHGLHEGVGQPLAGGGEHEDIGPEAFAEALLRLTRLCDEEFRLLRQAFWQAVPSREAMLDALEAFVIRLRDGL